MKTALLEMALTSLNSFTLLVHLEYLSPDCVELVHGYFQGKAHYSRLMNLIKSLCEPTATVVIFTDS